MENFWKIVELISNNIKEKTCSVIDNVIKNRFVIVKVVPPEWIISCYQIMVGRNRLELGITLVKYWRCCQVISK